MNLHLADLFPATTQQLPAYAFDHTVVGGLTTVLRGCVQDRDFERPDGLKGYVLQLTVAGSASVRAGQSGFDTSPGELLLFAPGQAHHYGRAEDSAEWRHYWVYFHPRGFWAPWLKWTRKDGGVGRITLEAAVVGEFVQMFEQIASSRDSYKSTAEELAINQLERLLIRCHEEGPDFQVRRVDPRVQRACQYISSHLDEDLSLDQIARHACLSPSRLSHVFREQIGVNILRWREDQRIILAKHMLQGPGRPISSIAARVGYDDHLYFSRVFRKRVGVSPSAYRSACEESRAA